MIRIRVFQCFFFRSQKSLPRPSLCSAAQRSAQPALSGGSYRLVKQLW